MHVTARHARPDRPRADGRARVGVTDPGYRITVASSRSVGRCVQTGSGLARSWGSALPQARSTVLVVTACHQRLPYDDPGVGHCHRAAGLALGHRKLDNTIALQQQSAGDNPAGGVDCRSRSGFPGSG
jgi:hypothetical protein